MKFLFKYPTMGRPEWFKKTLETYYSMLSGLHEYQFVISMNRDDKTMNNMAMRNYLSNCDCLKRYYANHKTKIEAINADMKKLDFDILFLISDDMIPQVKGFDDIIASDMEKWFPDIDGALHYDDGYCGGDKCITLSIIGKKLYDEFGYIYHPAYSSFYCDNEFTSEVYRMGKCEFIDQVIVKHEWGGDNHDDIYRRNSKLGKSDKAIFEARKKLQFPRKG